METLEKSVSQVFFVFDDCTNVNFTFRGVCNRCGSARPAGAGGGGAGGGGRGRGRGGSDSGGGRGGVGGPTGLFGPNDWSVQCKIIA
ncbi:putative Zinc finger, RanBP2-type superfamily [Helianthus anomalus]